MSRRAEQPDVEVIH